MKVAFKKPVSTLFLLPQLNKNYTHSHTRAHTLPLGDLVGLWILGGGVLLDAWTSVQPSAIREGALV